MTGALCASYAALLLGIAVPLAVVLFENCLARSCNARDRIIARGFSGTTILLVVSAIFTVHAIRVLLRTGRVRPVVVSIVPGLALGELGTAMLVSGGFPHGGLLSSAVVAGGLLPLLVLASPGSRRWTRAMTLDDGPHSIFLPESTVVRWDGRLSKDAVTDLSKSAAWSILVLISLSMLPALPAVIGVHGALAGSLWGATAVVSSVAGIAFRQRAVRRVQACVAREHGLPPGSCRWVLFTDPVIFDATLSGATASAHKQSARRDGA